MSRAGGTGTSSRRGGFIETVERFGAEGRAWGAAVSSKPPYQAQGVEDTRHET